MSERYDRLRRIRREKRRQRRQQRSLKKTMKSALGWFISILTAATWLWFCCIWIPDGIYGRTIHGANTDGWRIVSGQ